MSLDVCLYVEVDTGGPSLRSLVVFEGNLTHNLARMASEAGIYRHVWRPDECEGVACAGDLVEPLRAGIEAMEREPERFVAFNPCNGWGSFDDFLPWLREYLKACVENPKAKIEVSR